MAVYYCPLLCTRIFRGLNTGNDPRVKTSVFGRASRTLMKLETHSTVAQGKLGMTQPTPLGLPGRAVASLYIFPLLAKKEAELGTSH